MSSTEEQIHIHAPEGVLTILRGSAPPQPTFPQDSGLTIDSPANFLDARKDYAAHARAVINQSKVPYGIVLYLNEGLPLERGKIEGIIEEHPHFTGWGINSGRYINPSELLTIVRPRRSHFPNPDDYAAVVQRLVSFKAQLKTDIEQTRDGVKGRRADAVSREVVAMTGKSDDEDPSFSFVIEIPILRGTSAKRFEVVVLVEPRDAGVGLTLDSMEARDLQERLAETLIGAEIGRLSLHKIPLLYR